MLTFNRRQNRQPRTRNNRAKRGQSLIETAFGFTVIIILLGGTLDLSRVYFSFVSLEDAAGEAALYLSIDPGCLADVIGPPHSSDNGIDDGCDPPNNGLWRAQNAGGTDGFVTLNNGTLTADLECYDGSTYSTTPTTILCTNVAKGDIVEVILEYDVELVMWLVPKIMSSTDNPPQFHITSVATQTVIEDQT